MGQIPEDLAAKLSSPKVPSLGIRYMMINPLNASCLLELGFLSLVVECLLTDVPVFTELAEKNGGKNQAKQVL